MLAIDIDTLEWFQIKCEGLDEPMILIRKPHILELDIIEAEPVRHGRWVYGVTLNHEWRKCSECLVSQEIFGCFTYCPNCGAKMDGEMKKNGSD